MRDDVLIVAGYLLAYYEETMVINSANHSVCYAGSDTWDLTNAVVFRNYKYPDLTLPEPEFVPMFRHIFYKDNFDTYFSKDSLLEARKSLIQNNQEFDGTKNPA